MSGTIPLSMTQQFDVYGDPLAGGKLYFFVAGTVSTPQNAFQDGALTQAWPNPITLDATGRIPQLFLADGLIKIRLSDEHGVTQLVADNVQVIGPSSGGGGGGSTVDPTTIYQTGDLKPRYSTGAHTGWVRCNGNTIGSAVSGATERANADAQALFQHLWAIDTNLAVSGGRGANALADWTANKNIALPDIRGRVIAGLDDMGAAAAGRLTSAFFGSGTMLGAAGGEQAHILTIAELAAHTHPGTTGDDAPPHKHTGLGARLTANIAGGGVSQYPDTTSSTSDPLTKHQHPFTTDSTGAGNAHNTTQPTITATIYMKL